MSTATQTSVLPQTQSTCFGCGPDNPLGVQLSFRSVANGSQTATWVPRSCHESFQGIVHGGIVTTVLDEAMAKAVAATNVLALTCELKLRLRRSVVTGSKLTVTGWIVAQERRRIIAEASVCDIDGTELAHAWGTFLTAKGQGLRDS